MLIATVLEEHTSSNYYLWIMTTEKKEVESNTAFKLLWSLIINSPQPHKRGIYATETNLGYVAVNKAMFVVHNEVFEILWWKHPALLRVAQTCLLQHLPAALEGLLSCRQLQLLLMRTKQVEWEEDQKHKRLLNRSNGTNTTHQGLVV